jgi:nucleoside-diphosphate-sugar epimerase
VDPCILCDPPEAFKAAGIEVIREDVRNLASIPPGPVVYLASFHEFSGYESLGTTDKRFWYEAAKRIMVDIPKQITDAGRRDMIYISSMRALTHRTHFYGSLKALAERELFQRRNVQILRFGTVWGGMDPDLYNRTITVPNNWAVRGILPDENWKAYITPHVDVVNAVEFMLDRPGVGSVYSVVLPYRPCVAADLRERIPKLHPVPDELVKPEPHPSTLMAAYYGLQEKA